METATNAVRGASLAIAIAAATWHAPLGAAEVGATGGNLAVTPSGKLSYTIDIDVPPGVRDVAPAVAIEYVSGGANDVVGEGGSIAAVASVTRCPAGAAEDGVESSVLHTAHDAFCLDGQKLVLVDGAHGGDYAEYRTRIETFRRIRAHGSVPYPGGGTGPLYFVVEGGSGGRAEYGASVDSRIVRPATGVVDQWLLTRTIDVHGNEIVYRYVDFADGDVIERHLDRIDYGGNAGQNVEHHLAVVFSYEARPDMSAGYRRGMKLAQTRRLAAIRTEADGQVARRYTLHYETSPLSGNSRLAAIQECAGDGTTCYNPTTFGWSGSAYGWTATAGPPDDLVDETGRRRGALADVNGDGRTDWITAFIDDDGTFHRGAWMQTPTGWQYSAAYEPPAPLFDYTVGSGGSAVAELIDIDGDGLPDWVFAWRDPAGVDHGGVWLNTGTGFQAAPAWQLPDVLVDVAAHAGGVRRLQFAALDDDPFVDIFVSVRLPSGIVEEQAWLNTGLGWAPTDSLEFPVVFNDYALSQVGIATGRLVDINDDGLADVVQAVVLPDGTERRNTWIRTGDNFIASGSLVLPAALASHELRPEGEPLADLVDVNGDGLLDLVKAHSSLASGTENAAWLNTGTGWVSEPSFTLPALLHRTTGDGRAQPLGAVIDLDGDGHPDFVASYRGASGGSEQRAWRRDGDGWVMDNQYALPLELFTHRADGDSVTSAILMDVNGDNSADLVRAVSGTARTAYLNSTGQSGRASGEVIDHIINGLGFEQRIEYHHSDETDVYSPPDSRGSFPVLGVDGPMYLVGAVETSNGMGGFNRSEYRYGDLRVDVAEGRNLGFGWMSVRDPLTGSEVLSEFAQHWPHVGSLLRKTTRIGSTAIVEETHQLDSLQLAGGRTVFPYSADQVITRRELDGSHVSTISSTTEPDAFGAPLKITSRTEDETGVYTKVMENTFEHDTARWILSKLVRNITTVSAPNQPTLTRTEEFSFNVDGMLTSSTREPGHPKAVTTSYTYDGFGNRMSTTASAAGLAPRTGSVTFGDDGRFPVSVTNAAGHVTTQTSDPATGAVLSVTDPNGIVVEKVYDSLGHPLAEKRRHVDHEGAETTGVRATLRHWCSQTTSCPPHAVYFASAFTSEGDAPETVYFDLAGREVRRQTRGFASEGGENPIVYRDIEYNARGQRSRISTEYFAGAAPQWTTIEYDALDRPISQTAPNGALTRTFYEGRTRRTRNALGHETVAVLDAGARPVRVVDAAGGEMRYEYDAAGRLVRTTDPHGNQITVTYDIFGRKIAISDPDKGDFTYEYNAFGELVRQTDAKGESTIMEYDALGRMTSRVDANGETTWTYDTAANGIGRLDTVVQDSGYSRSHAWDDLGRATGEIVVIDGRSFTTEYRYQGISPRIDHVIHPSGLVVRHRYDLYGHPLDIRSDGLVELQDYQAQVALLSQLEDDLNDLYDQLEPLWQDHHANADGLIAAAKPHWDEAKRQSDEANQWIEKANASLNQARADFSSAVHFQQMFEKYDHQSKVYAHSYANHMERCEDPGLSSAQIEFHCVEATKQQINGQNAHALAVKYAQHRDAYDQRARDYESRAVEYFGNAETAINAANSAERAANDLYGQAKVHIEALDDIARQFTEAEAAVTQAADKAEALLADYNGASTLHWEAERINARGSIERFSQGNGVVTEISHFSDTGMISSIRATGDPAVAAPLAADEMQAYLDRLDGLIADYGQAIVGYDNLAANWLADQGASGHKAVLAREQAESHRAAGRSAYATIADAEAIQHDIDAAIHGTRAQLNNGLGAIYQQTVDGAGVLVLEYADQVGIPGQGRALEAKYHHLLTLHHRAIRDLYASLAVAFNDLMTASGQLTDRPTAELEGFGDLAAHSQHLAELSQLRQEAWAAQAISALDSGAPSATPLERRSLTFDAAVLERQGALFEQRSDVTGLLGNVAGTLNESLAAHGLAAGRLTDAAAYFGRTAAMSARAEQDRRLAAAYKRRGAAILAELDVLEGEGDPGEEGTVPADNPFAALVVQHGTQAGLYLAMAEPGYWEGLYAAMANRLGDVAGYYDDQAAENAALADEHALRAQMAENAASHQVKVGDNGEIMHETYTYDILGRLDARHDHAVELSESYQYDVLGRITRSQVSGSGAELYTLASVDTVSYDYDALGNFVGRSDVGQYTYGGPGAEGLPAGPHAVTRIDHVGGAHSPYAYDANGNLTAGGGRTLTWTAFDKPARISAAGASSEFTYGPERQLVKQVDDAGGAERTTYYIGARYEHIVSAEGEVSRFNVIYAGAVIAVIENAAGAAPDTHYLHSDRLGSVVAMSDAHGHLVERFRFDPFGERRIAVYDGTTGEAANLVRITSRGFTGHRELASLGLIHMGGRVYDPGIGRFLSADPYIQSPLSSQSYNRYSYLANSPVNGTDPSGFFSWNPKIPRHLSGYETWRYIASEEFNAPSPANVSWSLSQAKARQRAAERSANLLIQAELPHINGNFSREELYRIGTGRMDIGLAPGSQKRINAVIHQAWQWGEMAREIKKSKKWYKKYLVPIVAIAAAVVTYGAASAAATSAASASSSAVISGAAGTIGGVAGGAAAGFVGTFIATEGDVKAALKGAAGGAVLGGIGGYYGDTWNMGRVAANTVAGGAISDWNGGSYSKGARIAFVTSMARYGYNKLLKYDMGVTMEDSTIEPSGNYVEKMTGPIEVPRDGNTWGINAPLNPDANCGSVSFTCENYWLQGGPASVTVGTWWFMQAISKIHDWMQLAMDRIAGEQESWLRTVGNVPAMIPSVGIVGAGMMSGVPMGIYLTVDETRHRN